MPWFITVFAIKYWLWKLRLASYFPHFVCCCWNISWHCCFFSFINFFVVIFPMLIALRFRYSTKYFGYDMVLEIKISFCNEFILYFSYSLLQFLDHTVSAQPFQFNRIETKKRKIKRTKPNWNEPPPPPPPFTRNNKTKRQKKEIFFRIKIEANRNPFWINYKFLDICIIQ